jgi:hypothetical protein
MCLFYGEIEPNADMDAIADRLKSEFDEQAGGLPPHMAELLRRLAAVAS